MLPPSGSFRRIRGRLFALSPILELVTCVPYTMCFNLLESEAMVSTNTACLPPEHHIISHLPEPSCPDATLSLLPPVVPLEMVVQPTVNLQGSMAQAGSRCPITLSSARRI